MNLFISSDIEGTCGIAAWSETEPGRPDGDYAYFKQQMSREVAAACRGALAAGGERIPPATSTPLFCPKRCRSTGAGRAMFTA